MLKFIFWSLLAANAALLAVHYGNFGSPAAAGASAVHVPKPLNPEKLILIPASQAMQPASEGAAVAQEPAVQAATVSTTENEAKSTPGKIVACTEVGPFAAPEAKRFEASLVSLALGERQTRRNVQEVASHMVFIPSQGSKEGADKKAGELTRLGVKDFYVIQDNSNLRWGISLGVFKTEQASKNHLASLNSQGVRSAQIGARSVSSNKMVYELRNLDENAMQAVEKIKRDFPAQEMRACS